MRYRRWYVLGLALCIFNLAALSAPGSARAEGLRWKLKAGEELHYVTQRKIDGKLDFSGAPIDFKTGLVFDTTWKVKSVSADGIAEVEQTVDRLQFSMESPLGGALNYDSKKPDSGGDSPIWQQLEPLVTALVGQPIGMKVTPSGKVTDIQLPAKLTEQFEKQKQRQGGAGGGRRGGGLGGPGGGMFNEQGMKELVERSVQRLPDDGTATDATWIQQFESPMMGAGVMKTEIKYSPAGKDKVDGHQVEKISAKTDLTFEADEKSNTEVEIAEQDGESTSYFDVEAGRTIKVEGKQKTVFEITAPNRDIRQEIEETVTVKQGKSPESAEGESSDKKAK